MIYIKNISGSEKVYRGVVLQDASYHLISEADRIAWFEDESIMQAVANGEAQICKNDDGSGDIELKTEQWAYLGDTGVQRIETKMAEGGLRKSDRGLSFTATKNATTTADYLITEDLQIKGGLLLTENNKIFDSVGMEIVDTTYMYAGQWYPAEYAPGVPWSVALPNGVPLHAYIKDYPVSKDGITHITNEAITTTPLNGLTIRITYTSTGTVDDVLCNVGILAYS